MPCYKPMLAIKTAEGVRFLRRAKNDRASALKHGTMLLPCGQCTGCRLERSRQWAMRCVHESKMHAENCFITLTYENDALPLRNNIPTLEHKDFQDFMKRFRKKLSPHKIRYYMCGEYGEQFGRPHYHACIFGYDFPDKKLWTIRNGVPLFTSEQLSSLWEYQGHVSIGDVTFESAAYVARYIMKKALGRGAQDGPAKRAAEYTNMSRRDGIGKSFYEKYRSDMYPNDIAVMRGKIMKPPKYYDSLYEIEEPNRYNDLKAKRIEAQAKKAFDKTEKRLYAAQIVKEAQIGLLKRELE